MVSTTRENAAMALAKPRSGRIYLIMLLLAVAGAVGHYWWKYERVRRLAAEAKAMNGSIDLEYAGPYWLRDWAGEHGVVPLISWLWTDPQSILFSNGSTVDDVWLAKLPDCPNLLWLDLRKSKVTGAGLRHFHECQRLGQLDISGCPIGDSDLEPITQLKSLWNLRLAGTNVTDAGMETLQRVPYLQELDLSETQITDASISRLAEFPKLQKVNVTGTKVTKAGIQEQGSPRQKFVGP